MSASGSSASRKSNCATTRFADARLDFAAEEDDPLAEQPREDVERALEAAVGLDDHRDEVLHGDSLPR